MFNIRKLFSVIKKGNFKRIISSLRIRILRRLYLFRARFEDRRLGGVSIEKKIQSKYKELGANATQSTDYRLLDRVFKSFPLKNNDIFVDVGCGEGRVLTYLYLRRVRNKLIGIELDPDIAETAKKRTSKCENIEIFCANALECEGIIKNATAIYIFNPFDESVLLPFVEMIEKSCEHKVTLYYLNDVHRKHLDRRFKWRVIRRDVVYRPGDVRFPYSIYRYLPEAEY